MPDTEQPLLPLLTIVNPTPKNSLVLNPQNPVFKRPSESGELADVSSSVSSLISIISVSSESSRQRIIREQYEKQFVDEHERWKRRGILFKKIGVYCFWSVIILFFLFIMFFLLATIFKYFYNYSNI